MEANQKDGADLHVGAIVKKYIDTNKVFKSVVGRRMKKRDSEIIRYQKSASLKTDILLALCHAMKHNFFADIAVLLPAEYSTDVPKDTTAEDEIARLKDQIRLLESERNILKQVLIGKSE